MIGYTSVGAGSSIIAVRLNCPPEITLHRLIRTPPPDAFVKRMICGVAQSTAAAAAHG